jgi:hypothetical protein
MNRENAAPRQAASMSAFDAGQFGQQQQVLAKDFRSKLNHARFGVLAVGVADPEVR